MSYLLGRLVGGPGARHGVLDEQAPVERADVEQPVAPPGTGELHVASGPQQRHAGVRTGFCRGRRTRWHEVGRGARSSARAAALSVCRVSPQHTGMRARTFFSSRRTSSASLRCSRAASCSALRFFCTPHSAYWPHTPTEAVDHARTAAALRSNTASAASGSSTGAGLSLSSLPFFFAWRSASVSCHFSLRNSSSLFEFSSRYLRNATDLVMNSLHRNSSRAILSAFDTEAYSFAPNVAANSVSFWASRYCADVSDSLASNQSVGIAPCARFRTSSSGRRR